MESQTGRGGGELAIFGTSNEVWACRARFEYPASYPAACLAEGCAETLPLTTRGGQSEEHINLMPLWKDWDTPSKVSHSRGSSHMRSSHKRLQSSSQ